ncbi:hypothetical protein [Novilysobacter erysipheiresistens]
MTILAALEQATEAIEAPYFLLPIAGRDLPIKRERVYCYELFHQLRLALRDSQLTLTGEPDKRGHPDFPPINPDFILHTPGGHEENTAVVEVECRVGLEHLIKDFRNLKTMRDRGYGTLVLLLFANSNVPWPKLAQAAREADIGLGEIAVLLHRAPGLAATREHPPAPTAA